MPSGRDHPLRATVTVTVLDATSIRTFLATVGAIAERAPDLTGYETQSALFRAFEQLAEDIRAREE